MIDPKVPRSAAALCLLVAVSASGCSAGHHEVPSAGAAAVEASTARTLEAAPRFRESIGAETADDVVHCATTYLDGDFDDAPGGHSYVWAMCERVVSGHEAGTFSEAVRLTVQRVTPPQWADPETLPDDATPEQSARIFPGRFADLVNPPSNEVLDALQAQLEARRA